MKKEQIDDDKNKLKLKYEREKKRNSEGDKQIKRETGKQVK